VPRAHFFSLFFLHAELQDPQIEKHGKTETKTDQDKKHVCFLQTEVQFVVFSCLGGRACSPLRAAAEPRQLLGLGPPPLVPGGWPAPSGFRGLHDAQHVIAIEGWGQLAMAHKEKRWL
jgi:hypothetical protein